VNAKTISGRIFPNRHYDTHVYAGVAIEKHGRAFVVDDQAAAGSPGGLLDPEPRKLAYERKSICDAVHIPTLPLLLTTKAFAEMQKAASTGLFIVEFEK
jgi:hypothetical protein